MIPARYNLEAYHGDTWSQPFTFRNGDEPLNLTGGTVAAQAEYGAEIVDLTVTVINAAAGEIALAFPAEGLAARQWHYDVEVTLADGSVTTWVAGTLTVLQDVTNQ